MGKLKENEPSMWKWILSFSFSAGLAGMLCCVAPAVLFMFGLMSGIYAISFADFFYTEQGAAGVGAWVLRGFAVLIGTAGIILYRRRQSQCSLEPARKRKNLMLVTVFMSLLGLGFFFTLDGLSSWFFDEYIVPAQQAEYHMEV